MRIILLSFLLLTSCCISYAQSNPPKLSGKVKISIKEGTFECDFTLSGIPNIRNYFIRINSGMNVMHFRSVKPNDFLIFPDKSWSDTNSTGESIAYFFRANDNKSKFLPIDLRIRYVGKYPVITDTLENYAVKDWKGNIAFNHQAVRADGSQSAWYPIIYDIDKDYAYEKVPYDIEVECVDCDALYVNGNKPVKASKAKFVSEVPQEISLYCGNYDIELVDNTYLLNSGLTTDEQKAFTQLINEYQQFFTKNLKIPFEQPPVFISTTPVSKWDGWLFVSYPSIFDIGWGKNGLKSLFDPQFQNWYRPFIAHELGHYYFGTYKVFNSVLGDMISEGFSEYLAWQLAKNLISREVYQGKVDEAIEDLKDFESVSKPIGKVVSLSDYVDRDFYVYSYAPIIFSAIEKEIGDKKMWEWMRNILTTSTKFTDFDFLTSTLKQSIKNDKLYDKIVNDYFMSDQSLTNAIKKLKSKK